MTCVLYFESYLNQNDNVNLYQTDCKTDEVENDFLDSG